MATSPSLSFLLLLLLTITIVPSSSSEKAGMVGGRERIKNVNSNTEVQDLGKFSVDEYNKKHGTHLSFSQVIKAERQVVAGIKYYLLLDAVDGGVSGKYNAAVVVKAWLHTKELVSFEPATN